MLGNVFPQQRVSLGSSATPRTRFPIKFTRNRFASKVTRNDFQVRFQKFAKQGFQKKLPSKVPRPGTGSQARFPGTGFQEKVAKKVSKNRFASKGFPGNVPGNRFPSKVRKRFPSKVPRNRFPSNGS